MIHDILSILVNVCLCDTYDINFYTNVTSKDHINLKNIKNPHKSVKMLEMDWYE
jgi:hypothetical protein